MLKEIVDLGFRAVELGHGIRTPLVEGINQFLSEGALEVTSLHNFCPLPIDVMQAAPDCFQCTSHRPGERARALRHTLKTIDWAAKLDAKRVVLHLGSVPMTKISRRLLDHLKKGKTSEQKYVNLKQRAVRKRAKLDYYARVADWLTNIVEHAKQAGIRLGVENRIEIDIDPGVLGYWHDFGHAQIRQHLTLSNHREWFIEMLPYLIGCHVHDVKNPDSDHQLPFAGDMPFSQLVPLISSSVPLVWELRPSIKPAEIRAALQCWNAAFKNDNESLALSG
jgi:sugar phosphate isomerase/epimerase